MKKGIRSIAIASGPIDGRRRALIVGVVGRFGVIEGVVSSSVAVDGDDATAAILKMIRRSRFCEQIRIIALNGIAIAGLNVIDAQLLEKGLGVKIVVLTRSMPRPRLLVRALKELSKTSKENVEKRIALVEAQAKIKRVRCAGIYLQGAINFGEMKKLAGSIYDLLRIAHLVARGVETGESKGRI